MSCFFYFIPNAVSVSQEDIEKLGLDDRIDYPVFRRVIAHGPDCGRGCIAMQRDGENMPMMNAASQTWRAAPRGDMDSPPYWIGFTSADPPGPESLARPSLMPGVNVTLEDDNAWHVPNIRNWHDSSTDEIAAVYSTQLPQTIDYNDQGQAVHGNVTSKFTRIWELALSIHQRLYADAIEDGEGSLSADELYRFAADAIAVNYKVSLLELAVLGVLSTLNSTQVTRVALDCDGYENAVKNWAGRSVSNNTVSNSGNDRPNEESSQAVIDPLSVS